MLRASHRPSADFVTSTDQIKTSPTPNAHSYHLLVVPRMSTLCTSVLSDLGVLGSLDVQEFQLGLIPLEKDLLSLEYEDVWKKLCLVRQVYFQAIARSADRPTASRRTATSPRSTTWGRRS